MPAFFGTLTMQSRQLSARDADIVDIPTGGDPTSRNSSALAKAGRSMSVELVRSGFSVTSKVAGVGDVVVSTSKNAMSQVVHARALA